MAAIGGSRTRDIAVETRAELRAHAAQHAADVADVNRTFSENRAETARMHSENKQDWRETKEELHGRIDKVEKKVDALPWKIIGALGALLVLATTALGYLIVHGGTLFGGH